MQAIFGCKMLEAINRGEYLIKFDEASYSRSVKLAYTWLPRGESSSIINKRFKKCKSNICFVSRWRVDLTPFKQNYFRSHICEVYISSH